MKRFCPIPSPIAWEIDVTTSRCGVKVDRSHIRSLVEILSQKLEKNLPPAVKEQGRCSLSLLFTNDARIQRLNREWRGKNKPTDVLSFSQLEGEGAEAALAMGDIVISMETAAVQARRAGCSLNTELKRLLIHGFLHLLGFDHEKVSRARASQMRSAERRLRRELRALTVVKSTKNGSKPKTLTRPGKRALRSS